MISRPLLSASPKRTRLKISFAAETLSPGGAGLGPMPSRLLAYRPLGLETAGVELHRSFVQRVSWDEPERASSDAWSKDFATTGDPARDAFEALWRIYFLWHIEPDGVPFIRNERVDPEQILALSGR